MPNVAISPQPKLQFFDANGNPLVGGKLYSYDAGTTTPRATYTDSTGNTANTNPVFLDSRGEASVWMDSGYYKLALFTATDVPVWTVDNVSGTVALAQLAASGGSSLIGFLQSGANAQTRTVQSKLRDVVSVFDYMTSAQIADVSTRAALLDVTSAVQAAINAAGDASELFWPEGVYRITATLVQRYNRQRWRGAGRGATQLYFAPTADDTCVEWGTAAALTVLGSMSDIGFYSDNSSFKKIAIDVIDADIAVFERISIQGGVTVSGTLYWSGANSVGIRCRGRDHITFSDIYIAADAPFQFSDNPSNSIDVDNIVMRDHYLIGNGNPIIQIDSGINLTQLTFEGRHSWNKGTAGFRWIDTTSSIVSNGLVFKNIRYEQGTDSTAYGFDIQHNTGLQGVTFMNCYSNSERRGVRLRKCEQVNFFGHYHVGVNEALNVDATVKRIRGSACFWQAGSTATMTGQRLVYGAPLNPNTAPLPPDFYYDESANGQRNELHDGVISSTPFTLANNTTRDFAANTTTGLAVISVLAQFSALYFLNGTNASVNEISDPTALFTPTSGNAGTVNVFWNAGTSSYRIENRTGFSLNIVIVMLGSYS